jgi:hypothetical protein
MCSKSEIQVKVGLATAGLIPGSVAVVVWETQKLSELGMRDWSKVLLLLLLRLRRPAAERQCPSATPSHVSFAPESIHT